MITIRYQGILCGPAFEYVRAVGLEPSFGYVHVPRSQFADFTLKESLPGLDVLNASTRSHETPEGAGFFSSGDLEFIEEIDELEGVGDEAKVVSKKHATKFELVLVSERAAEVALSTDAGTGDVRIELTDVRYLWGTRGVIFGWFNVPRQGTAPLGSGSTDAQALAAAQFIQGSLRGDKAWTLSEVLSEVVLPALPGRPRLQRIPEDLKAATPIGHVWDGVPAKLALKELLEEFDLVLALNADSSVSLWREGEGPLALEDGQVIDPRPMVDGKPNASCDDRVADAYELISYNYIPPVVLVIGPPIIENALMSLEPVGEVAGRIVPLKQALDAIGMGDAAARRFALLTREKRLASNMVGEDAIREFDRWAFKWFRIPGGAELHGDRLPILDRGAVDAIGQWQPVRVWSESFMTVDALKAQKAPISVQKAVAQLNDDIAALNGEIETARAGLVRAQEAAQLAADLADQLAREDTLNQGDVSLFRKALEAGMFLGVDSVDFGPDGLTITNLSKLRAQAEAARKAAELERVRAAAVLRKVRGDDASQSIRAKLAGLKEIKHFLVLVNQDFAEQNSGFTLDRQHGVVRFDRLQGHIDNEGKVADENQLVRTDASVTIEFGFARKPSPDQRLSIAHRYFSVWVRDEAAAADAKQQAADALDGKPRTAKVKQIGFPPPEVIPFVVERPDLQQVIGLEGASNRALLDTIARQTAESILLRPQAQAGVVVEFGRPVQVRLSGAVKTVRWATPGGKPEVTVHVGRFAPILPRPEAPRTRARTGPDSPTLRGNVFAPRGFTGGGRA